MNYDKKNGKIKYRTYTDDISLGQELLSVPPSISERKRLKGN
jgi:hypothetical protein